MNPCHDISNVNNIDLRINKKQRVISYLRDFN
jgi:hypothetical protein